MSRWVAIAGLLLACSPPPVRSTNRGVLFLSVEGSDEAPAEMPRWDMGEVVVGARKELVIRATNVGSDPLTVTGVYLGAIGNGSFFARNTGGKLEQDESLTATVTFSPATKGSQQTQVTFSHDADSALPSLHVTGTGI